MRGRMRDEREWRSLSFRAWIIISLCLVVGTLFSHYYLLVNRPADQSSLRQDRRAQEEARPEQQGGKTLVIYVFRNTDGFAIPNLFHFIESIRAGDPAKYIILLDPAVPKDEMPQLPALPHGTEVVQPPPCFASGAVGWLLFTSKQVSMADHEYFVWVSSSVRGPLLPSYVTRPWHMLLTERITADTKLVGATISCSLLLIDKAQPPVQNPHVQNHVMATDSVGLKLLKSAGALDCHANWMDNVRFAEFGASAAILAAGYNLDCLMLRYQGVDWREKSSWGCNARIDPHRQETYDGVSLNPLEVLFVPVDYTDLVLEIPHAYQAAVYSQWERERRGLESRNISGNSYLHTASRKYNDVMAKPKPCFDHELYIMASPVEFKGYSADDAYQHFKTSGYREGRPHGFLC